MRGKVGVFNTFNDWRMSKKIWIDTDGAADDVRAISIALQHPDVEVRRNIIECRADVRLGCWNLHRLRVCFV